MKEIIQGNAVEKKMATFVSSFRNSYLFKGHLIEDMTFYEKKVTR